MSTVRHSVAAVRLPAAPPPQRGRCPSGEWFTYGPDLILLSEIDFWGDQFRFPGIIGFLDEAIAIAGRVGART